MTDFSVVGTQNIEKPLFREHGLVHKSGRRKPPALWEGKQEKPPPRNIVEMLNRDTSDPREQAIANAQGIIRRRFCGPCITAVSLTAGPSRLLAG
jgi:hypothetical protein